jgi:hypothetical protein
VAALLSALVLLFVRHTASQQRAVTGRRYRPSGPACGTRRPPDRSR